MKVHKYKSYDEYVASQKNANRKKAKNVWAEEKNIATIAEFLQPYNPRYGICHGVRQGLEQKWFMQYLPECEVIGTEIGEVRQDDKYTMQWDFNKENHLLKNKFDFLYSNSFDHAFNPASTFRIWADQVKTGGFIVFEYDRRQEHTGEVSKKYNSVDPVSITAGELIERAPSWSSRVKYHCSINMPVVTQEWRIAIIFEVL